MNLLQQKCNRSFREALVDGDVEKARKWLRSMFTKPDINGVTNSGKFSMLHCATLSGNIQAVLMTLQAGADKMALTQDGYSALDIALWKKYNDIAELLRAEGCIAPMKEPHSLTGKVIDYDGKEATVVDYIPCQSPRQHYMRALHYSSGENLLLDLWSGDDYQIIGENNNVDALRKLNFRKMSIKSPESCCDDQIVYDDTDDDDDDESERKDTCEVTVPAGPLGVLLNGAIPEKAVVQGFTLLPDGQRGAIELTGDVLPGMQLVGINSTDVSSMSLQKVTRILGKLGRKEKLIRFRSSTSLNIIATISEEEEEEGGIAVNNGDFAECIHCGVPSSVHKSIDCPYQ